MFKRKNTIYCNRSPIAPPDSDLGQMIPHIEFLGGSRSEPAKYYDLGGSRQGVFYVYGEIVRPANYLDLIHTLNYAQANDEITIRINSQGGELSSCLAICNAIANCQGHVITIIEGQACSAAAFIWLSGHTRALASEDVYLMAHHSGWSMTAKAPEHLNQSEFMIKVITDLFTRISSGLLNAEEMNRFKLGLDVYVHGSDLIKRLGDSDSNDA